MNRRQASALFHVVIWSQVVGHGNANEWTWWIGVVCIVAFGWRFATSGEE